MPAPASSRCCCRAAEARRREARARDAALANLAFVGLADYADETARNMPYGAIKRLEIARALSMEPDILMLDEPAAGLNPAEADALMDLVRQLHASGKTILIIEHNMRVVMGLCQRIVVIDAGTRIAEGPPDVIQGDAKVREAYLVPKAPALLLPSAARVLRVDGLATGYGHAEVLHGVTLAVEEGEIVAVVGANGAGKSTLLKTISGLLPARQGEIGFLGSSIASLAPEEIVRRGVVHIPEGRRVFPHSTIDENLTAGAYVRSDAAGVEADRQAYYRRFPALHERRGKLASTLSGGEQQMLAICRGLMSRPKLILMDEPSLGLAPMMVDQVFEIVAELNREGKSILLVEQNATRALAIADRAYVMVTGEIVLSGPGRELLDNEEVQRSYLGS